MSVWGKIGKNPIFRLVVGFLLAAIVLFAFGWIVTGPYKSWVAGFDSNIRYFMRQIQSPMWSAVFLTFTKLGSTLYLAILGSIAGITFLYLRWFKPFALLNVLMLGQAALHYGAKLNISRPRPAALIRYSALDGSSFPSGHAIAILALCFFVAWCVTTRLENDALKFGVWSSAVVVVLLVAASRVYIGVHYSTDVIAGLVASLIWTASVISCDRRPL